MPVRAPQYHRTGRHRPRRSEAEPPLREKQPDPDRRPDQKDRREQERRQDVDPGRGGDAAER